MIEHSTVVGVFEDREAAERAVGDLERSGFGGDQIGFARRDGERDEGARVYDDPTSLSDETGTRAEERAVGSAEVGGALGGLLGAAAALLIPGIGPAVAGGVLAATLGGAAAGAAAGGIAGALSGLGVPEHEARYYEGELHGGRTIVTVQAEGRAEEATAILSRHGAYDMATGGEPRA